MDSLLRLPTAVNVSLLKSNSISRKKHIEYHGVGGGQTLSTLCFASKKRGFGPEPTKEERNSGKAGKVNTPDLSESSALLAAKSMPGTDQAPGLKSRFKDTSGMAISDRQFIEKLEAVKRSAVEKRKAEEGKFTQAMDYDTPIEAEKNTVEFGTKVGVGIAVVVFGTVFALGDFLPSGSVTSNETQVAEKKLTDEEKSTLQSRLQKFEATLSKSPNDLSAAEGAAVTLTMLGEYGKASSLLEKLTKERPDDYEAYLLLGEVKYELKDYDGSAQSYRNSLSASGSTSFEALRGLTNALLASKKPEEAVQVLLSYTKNHTGVEDGSDVTEGLKDEQNVDPIQVQLLLGKAYSDWRHVNDAVAVYDQLIFKHPSDFRGYLAKGIILKENGKPGDAERMFIQARFFAPEKAKSLVDRYARN